MQSTNFGRVAVLAGGTSSEREVSLKSGQAVTDALHAKGIDAHLFDPKTQALLGLAKYDRVFNVLHGKGGEDGAIQGFLSCLDIPQTGSGITACAIGMDKIITKQIWAAMGLPTAPFIQLDKTSNWEDVVDALGLPLMVKPVCEGSSIGMTRVDTLEELPQAYAKAATLGQAVMAERFIRGKEYTIAIVDAKAYPVIGLTPAVTEAGFYDFEAKYERTDGIYSIPSGLTQADEFALQALSLRAFNALGATGWGRIDAMRDADGHFYLLEINTVPGMTATSLVPKAAHALGISFEDLCEMILHQTL